MNQVHKVQDIKRLLSDIKRLLSDMRRIDLARLDHIWFDPMLDLTPMGSSKLSLIISGHEELDQEFDQVDMISSLIDSLYILAHTDDADDLMIQCLIVLFIEKLQFHYEV